MSAPTRMIQSAILFFSLVMMCGIWRNKNTLLLQGKEDVVTLKTTTSSEGGRMLQQTPTAELSYSSSSEESSSPPFSHLNLLSLGGSVTWGAELSNPEFQSYPSRLKSIFRRSDNLAIRSTGAVWPAQCIQSMICAIRNETETTVDNYDVIVLEFSLNGLLGLQLLLHRLRRRYPNALLLYVDLYSNRKPGYSNCIGGDASTNSICRMTTAKHKAFLRMLGKVNAYNIELPRPKDPHQFKTDNIIHWFGPDHHHLNSNGHEWVAEQIMHHVEKNTIQQSRITSPSTATTEQGTWLEGDVCLSWFHTGILPQEITIISDGNNHDNPINEFAPTKYAYEISNNKTSILQLDVSHRFSSSATSTTPLSAVYMTTRNNNHRHQEQQKHNDDTIIPLYPSVVQVAVSDTQNNHTTIATTKIPVDPPQWVSVGEHVTTVHWIQHYLSTAEPHKLEFSIPSGSSKWPFRLVGLVMCAACPAFDSNFLQRDSYCNGHKSCVNMVTNVN